MGGHVSGETASRLACDQYVQSFSTGNGSVASRMEQSLLASNEALTSAIQDNGALKGMGCTIVAGYLDEEGLRWISVGDSALLLYRNGTLRRLNADHSVGAMLNKQVEAGLIAPEMAMNDPRRRALRSALTGATIPLKDCEFDAYPLQASDWVVLATDGLEVLTGNEIATAIQKHEHQEAEMVARSLIAAVEQKRERYQDNTTVIVLRVAPPSSLQDQAKRADDPQQDADMAKTVLIDPQGKSGAASELMSKSHHTEDAAKEPGKRSWWPRVKLFLLAAAVLGGFIALGLGDRTMAADHDQSCRTEGINCQPNMNQAL
jgi:serine/threonine protein phosphatase PrpC